jgi:hypothetical protein
VRAIHRLERHACKKVSQVLWTNCAPFQGKRVRPVNRLPIGEVLTGWADVDVDISNDVLDGFDNLLEDVSFDELGFEHFESQLGGKFLIIANLDKVRDTIAPKN